MSEIKVNSIKGVGASVAALSINNTDGTCTANLTNRTNKNLIINGGMTIAQRSVSSTSTGYGSVDRYSLNYGGTDEAPTIAQVDVASGTTPYTLGFLKALKLTNGNQTSGAGTADYMEVYQYLEDQDIANSGWNFKSSSSFITISFWIKSSVAQKFTGFFYTNEAGAGNSYMYSYEIDNGSGGNLTADTWTKVTHSIAGNSNLSFSNDNTKGLAVGFYPFNGTNYTTSDKAYDTWSSWDSSAKTRDMTSTWFATNDATLEITGLQLEVGSVATDFEHRSFGQELALCQRYLYVLCEGNNTPLGNGTCWTVSNVFIPVIFPVKMRAAPSMTVATGSGYYSHFQNGTGAAESGANFTLAVSLDTACEIYDNSTNVTANASCFSRNQNAASKITFSAEL